MEISVRIIQLLEPQSFVSKRDGSTIFKYTFVGETAGQYPKKVAFTVMGEDKFKGMGIAVGNSYSVSFDEESREWNGKWFTEVLHTIFSIADLEGRGQSSMNLTQPHPEIFSPLRIMVTT